MDEIRIRGAADPPRTSSPSKKETYVSESRGAAEGLLGAIQQLSNSWLIIPKTAFLMCWPAHNWLIEFSRSGQVYCWHLRVLQNGFDLEHFRAGVASQLCYKRTRLLPNMWFCASWSPGWGPRKGELHVVLPDNRVNWLVGWSYLGQSILLCRVAVTYPLDASFPILVVSRWPLCL